MQAKPSETTSARLKLTKSPPSPAVAVVKPSYAIGCATRSNHDRKPTTTVWLCLPLLHFLTDTCIGWMGPWRITWLSSCRYKPQCVASVGYAFPTQATRLPGPQMCRRKGAMRSLTAYNSISTYRSLVRSSLVPDESTVHIIQRALCRRTRPSLLSQRPPPKACI